MWHTPAGAVWELCAFHVWHSKWIILIDIVTVIHTGSYNLDDFLKGSQI